MKFLYIIKKCEQVGLLFFIVSVANAAPIEDSGGYLDNQLEAFAFVIDEEAMGLADTPTISQGEVKELQDSTGKSQEQQNLLSTQYDKPKTTLGDLQKDQVRLGEAKVYSRKSTKEVNSGNRANINTLKNDFLFKNKITNSDIFNQNQLFLNNQDLKMLAHDIFGEQTLNDVLMAREEVKMLLKLTNAWIKEVLFDDRNWRLEDSIYGSAAIMFIKDSSLIRFLKKLDGNPDGINRTRKYSEQQNNSHDNLGIETDAGLVQGNFGVLEFWNKYSGLFFYIVLPIIILREVYKLISNTLKPKKKHNSRRGPIKKSRHTNKKERISDIPLSADDGIASNRTSNSGVARREKYKQPSRRKEQSSRRRVK